jgi:hypothetical protein
LAVFSSTANGTVAPLRLVVGSSTDILGASGGVQDASKRSYVSNAIGQTITVYSKTANGNVAPNRKIGGSKTGFISPDGVTI